MTVLKAAEAEHQADVARKAARDEFNKQYGIAQWTTPSDIMANPFIFKGTNVALRVNFVKMITEDEAQFGGVNCNGASCADSLFVLKVPTTEFKGGESLILALKVKGTRARNTGTGEIRIPDVEFVGDYLCKQSGCGDIEQEVTRDCVGMAPGDRTARLEPSLCRQLGGHPK